jgi:hypothetical protein
MIPFSQMRERAERMLFDRHELPVRSANWLLDLLRFPFALIRDLIAGELNLRAMGLSPPSPSRSSRASASTATSSR